MYIMCQLLFLHCVQSKKLLFNAACRPLQHGTAICVRYASSLMEKSHKWHKWPGDHALGAEYKHEGGRPSRAIASVPLVTAVS